jgi:HK97 gp10 family phage protein
VSRGTSVTIEGLPELRAALARKTAELRAASTTAVAEEVGKVRDDAVLLAPRKTGALEAGIRGEAAGLTGAVTSSARHSTFVEHGTYKDKAQPFMRPASEAARHRFPSRAAAILRSVLEGR